MLLLKINFCMEKVNEMFTSRTVKLYCVCLCVLSDCVCVDV